MVQSQPLPFQIPPLENGDRLSWEEFERRYQAMPQVKKAELIEGVVYMPAALRFRSHGQLHSNLMTWLGTYAALTPGVASGDNPTVRLDRYNEPQPDAVLLIEPESGGQTRLSADDYIVGPPELIVEIAASSAAIDLGDKKQVYQRHGVQEYLVWQVFDHKLDWFHWQATEYAPLPIDQTGAIQSRVFPGLWLAVNDLLSGNMAQVLTVLQTGVASGAHAAFVQKLIAVTE